MFKSWIVVGLAIGMSEGAYGVTCEGPSDDGQAAYAVTVDKNADGRPVRVRVVDDTGGAVEFGEFEDRTPKGPTDERYRLVFHDGSPVRGELAVMLMEGGFTQLLTIQLWQLEGPFEEPRAFATITCPRED